MKILRIVSVVLILGLLIFASIPIPSYAISSTTILLQINSVSAFKNNLELADMAFAVDYTVTYAATPTEIITDTYNVRLMNGATELRSVAPYSFFNNGYNKGLVWIYFTAAEVVSKGLTWSGSYTVRLDGNPTATWTGAIQSASPYGSISWTNTSTTVAANSILLTNYVLAEAQAIENAWNTTGYDLYISTALSGAKLTSTGESYFSNVIPSLDILCPNALQTTSLEMDLFSPSPTPNKYADSIASDSQGTEYTTGTATFTQGSNQVTGTTTSWTSAMVGGMIKDNDEYAYYGIQSIDVGTQTITLNANYVPATSANSGYLILYNASQAPTSNAILPFNLTMPASALHVSKTVLGTVLALSIIVWVAMHGAGAANSYRPLILISLPLLYVFTRIGWLPLGFTIGLGILASLCTYYVFFYEKTSQ